MTALKVDGSGVTQPVSGTVTVQDGGGSLTVDGSVSISGSVPVTGTFWQATQPVSGPLTAAELFASPVTVSLGSSTDKVNVMKTGTGATTAVTADQTPGSVTHTVTSGKTLYLEYFAADARLSTFATTATYFGTASLEIVSGTKVITRMIAGAGISTNPAFRFSEPIPIAAGTVVRVVCTPSSTTNYTWNFSFGGYEK